MAINATTIKLTEPEYWVVIKHKALLECETWESYLVKLMFYPRHRRELRYEEPDDTTRSITMRMEKEVFNEINKIRKSFFKPWREFVLESAYGDGIVEAYEWFKANSLVERNRIGGDQLV